MIGGSLGLHRFYLHGFRDRWGWLFVWPTLVGLYGVQRMRQLGGDDHLAWALIPLLGLTLAIGMFSAIVYGLTPDERWNARFNPTGPQHHMGWATVIGVGARAGHRRRRADGHARVQRAALLRVSGRTAPLGNEGSPGWGRARTQTNSARPIQ